MKAMRERVIALIVCSMIFVAVLIIGVITAARSTVRTEPENPVAVEKAPVQPLPPPPPEEPPPKKTRYKRRNTPAVYSNFINPAAPVKLPGNLAAYKFKALPMKGSALPEQVSKVNTSTRYSRVPAG